MSRAQQTSTVEQNTGGAVAPFVAGKNKIINGDLTINQRAFTSNTASGAFNFDRFFQLNGGSSGTLTVTPQTFTAGTAPVAGYEATNFIRCITAAGVNTNTYALLEQKIEDVRTFAGQTVTASFWAKAGSGTPNISIELEQSFGSGGSASIFTSVTKTAITTSWARYTFTVAVPSISGKTIGTGNSLILSIWLSAGSDFNTRSNTTGLQNNTFDIWGVQIEAGSVATAFQTASGTLQGELALCQRYYQRLGANGNNMLYPGFNNSTTELYTGIPLKVTMRTNPTITLPTVSSNFYVRVAGGSNVAVSAYSVIGTNYDNVWLSFTSSGLTSGQGSGLVNQGSSTYMEFSAEL